MPSLGLRVRDPTKRSGCSRSARSVSAGDPLRLTSPISTPHRSISERVNETGSAVSEVSWRGTSWNMYSAGMVNVSFDARLAQKLAPHQPVHLFRIGGESDHRVDDPAPQCPGHGGTVSIDVDVDISRCDSPQSAGENPGRRSLLEPPTCCFLLLLEARSPIIFVDVNVMLRHDGRSRGDHVTTTPVINVLDPQFYVDPWASYRWLQDEAPVFRDPVQQIWVISRYDDVRSVEKDGVRFSSFDGSRPHIDHADESMINMDDPAHQAQRSLVLRRFTPRAIRGHEEQVRDIITGILDDVAPRGECEAIEAIASRLPAIMIGALLGYPHELWERVRHWSEQIMLLAGQTSPDGPPHVTHPGIVPVIGEFVEVTTALIEKRRSEPHDDLISLWAHAGGWDAKHILDEAIPRSRRRGRDDPHRHRFDDPGPRPSSRPTGQS